MVSPDLGSFNNYHLFSSFEERINSPECLHKAVDSHQHVVGALLRPAFGDGEDGPVDILRVGHDITALSLCSTSSHLWWVVGLPRTLRLIVALRGREREVFNRIGIHQHSDLEGMEVLLNRIKKQEAVVEVDLGSNMYSLISKAFCQFFGMVTGQLFGHIMCIEQVNFYLVSKLQSLMLIPGWHKWKILFRWEVLGHWLNWQALGSNGGKTSDSRPSCGRSSLRLF